MCGNYRDLCAAEHCCSCKCKAHLAAGVVGDKADGVDALTGCACGNEYALACKVLLIGSLADDVLQQSLLVGELSVADVAVCQHTADRLHYLIAELSQLVKIVLNYGVVEHIMVHGRSDYLLAGASHDRGGQHIVGNAVCYLAYDVCRGRSYHDHICLLGDGNVLHTVLKVAVKCVDEALVLSKSLKCQGVYEIE